MRAPFEIEWLGGVAEKHFRRLRPSVAELPWGTLDVTRYPPRLVERARRLWTHVALSEYRAALSFSELLRLLLEARAPLDLVGMAGDFVADEVSHVEIAARVAMELGGAASVEVDTSAMLPSLSYDLGPLEKVNERMLRTAVQETFSESLATGVMRSSNHLLLKSAVELIARDEARHTRIGWLYFDWAREITDDVERARLGNIALELIEHFADTWHVRQSRVVGGVTSEGYDVDHVRELGWLDSETYARRAKDCIRREIVPPLAARGITVDGEKLERILST